MNIPYLFQCFLTLHITGLVMMAGSTLFDFTTFRIFWNLIDQGKEWSWSMLHTMSKSGRFIGIGAALLVLSGIGMMALTNGVFGEQLWFRIKFGIVIILIMNALLAGRQQGLKLRQMFTNAGPDILEQTKPLRIRLNRYYLLQLLFFFIIVFLSVFKFS